MHTFFFLFGIIAFIVTVAIVGLFFYLGWVEAKFDEPERKLQKIMALYLRRLIGVLLYILFAGTVVIMLVVAIVVYLSTGREILKTWCIAVMDDIEIFVEREKVKK